MMYKITYKRKSDRDYSKWSEFSEYLRLKELNDCMKWLEKNKENHELVSVVPVKAGA